VRVDRVLKRKQQRAIHAAVAPPSLNAAVEGGVLLSVDAAVD
tara:strand:- start:470 stop:595 length:126 start_codon:yes stop_codon:yes gene_type:complete